MKKIKEVKNGSNENNAKGQGTFSEILRDGWRRINSDQKNNNENRKEDELKEHDWITKFTDKFKDNIQPQNTYLINMELRNGLFTTFMISTNKTYFEYQNAMYIIDSELKYYNINSKCFMLDYHQDFDLPIKKIVQPSEINKAIKLSGLTEIENATNPSTLQNFITSKVAEGVMKGQAIVEEFKIIKILLIIAAGSSIIHLLIFVFKSGMLDSVKGLI